MSRTGHDYPEHEKLKKVAGESQTVGEFLEWLEERGLAICRPADVDTRSARAWVPTQDRPEELLAAYFGIDLGKIQREKAQMVDGMRKVTEAARKPR